jgi:hypothetical protein
MKLVLDTLRRGDLDENESRNFLARNIDRLYSTFVRSDSRLRIRLLVMRRKYPLKNSRQYLRLVARSYLAEKLKECTLQEVDALLSEFLSPAKNIEEVTSSVKPKFRIIQRRPEFRKVQFPEREARARGGNGRLKKLPWTYEEIQNLYFYLRVHSSSAYL